MTNQVRAAHILRSSEKHGKEEALEKIEEIKAEIDDGSDFSELATAHSDCPSSSRGGDLGTFGRGAMVPAFEEAAFQLTDGEISPPIMTGDGYSIIQLLEREYSPFLIENEYLQMKERLGILAKTYKKRPAVREYTDKVLDELGLKIFSPAEIFPL